MKQSPSASPSIPDPATAEHSRRVYRLICDESDAHGGLLPFDRFMDLALYAPGLGYYVAGSGKLGAGGDFVTAPELSPVFGHCIAEQCRQVFEVLGSGDILEFGAGSGALAVHVLSALSDASALPRRYLILEVSPELQARQRQAISQLAPALTARVSWTDRLPTGFRGCVLANEVLDAMPVNRFRIDRGGEPLELCVRPTANGLEEVAVEPVSHGLREAVRRLQERDLAIDPGFESEINLRLAPWIRALAGAMDQGLVLLIDYGYPRSEYYRPDRRTGTLMCHFQHQAHSDPYRNLGLQDITAHVDFTAVAEAAGPAEMGLAGYSTQAHFLIGCGLDRLLEQGMPGMSNPSALLAAKLLLLPSAMGERFQVLGLQAGMEGNAGPWLGFSFRDLRDRLF